MANETAALVVALSAQVSKFEKDMKDATKIADTQTKAIESRFAKMNDTISGQFGKLSDIGSSRLGPLSGVLGSIGPLGLAIGAGIGVAALAFDHLYQSTKAYIDQAGKLRDTADTTGLTITQLDELNKVGLTVGVSAEETTNSINKMTVAFDQLREANGPLYEVLKKTPDAMARISNAKDATAAVDELAKHFASLGSEFEKNAFLRAAFGRGGIPFGRVLQSVADAGGLRQMEEDAKRTGKAIDESVVKAVDDLDDELKLLKKTADDLWGETWGRLILQAQKNAVQMDIAIAQDTKTIQEAFISAKQYVLDFFNTLAEQKAAAKNDQVTLPQLVVPPRGPTPLLPPAPKPTQGAQPDILAQLTGEAAPLPPSKPETLTLTLDQRIKKLRDYIAVMGDVVSATKKWELSELTLEKAVKDQSITEEDANRKRTVETIELQIETLQKQITAMGGAADKADLLFLEELKLQKARAQGNITAKQRADTEKYNADQLELSRLATKEAAGVITEEELAHKELLAIKLQARREGQNDIDLTNAEILAHNRAKEAIEARTAALSKLPQAARYAQDSMNGFKQADQFLVSFAGNFENTFADIASGTKTAAQAFKELADSIIRDLIRITIRMTVTGPLLANISSLFSPAGVAGAAGGGTNFLSGLFGGARAGGGPVSSGKAYLVGENGPEIFVPQSAGHISPNSMTTTGRSGGGQTVEINNYVSAETETRQQKRNDPGGGERVVIDIIKKAQARGDFDDVNRGRFGARPVKVR